MILTEEKTEKLKEALKSEYIDEHGDVIVYIEEKYGYVKIVLVSRKLDDVGYSEKFIIAEKSIEGIDFLTEQEKKKITMYPWGVKELY